MKEGVAIIIFSIKRNSTLVGLIIFLIITSLLHFTDPNTKTITIIVPILLIVLIFIISSNKTTPTIARLCPHCGNHYLSKKLHSPCHEIYVCPNKSCPEVIIQ